MDNGESSYRRFLDGDESAFDEIMKEYRDSLTFFIDRIVRDMAVAEDIAIDVFTDLIVHRHRYDFRVKLKTYLFMLGRSRALNYVKRRTRIGTVEISEAEDEADRYSVEEAFLSDERKKIVNSAIEKLPDDMRAAVHLVYFEELSYEDAAKVMGKKRKAVDNLLYRAKSMLRDMIGEEI